MHLKMSSAKWRPFCLGLNVLTLAPCDAIRHIRAWSTLVHNFWTHVDLLSVRCHVSKNPTWHYSHVMGAKALMIFFIFPASHDLPPGPASNDYGGDSSCSPATTSTFCGNSPSTGVPATARLPTPTVSWPTTRLPRPSPARVPSTTPTWLPRTPWLPPAPTTATPTRGDSWRPLWLWAAQERELHCIFDRIYAWFWLRQCRQCHHGSHYWEFYLEPLSLSQVTATHLKIASTGAAVPDLHLAPWLTH